METSAVWSSALLAVLALTGLRPAACLDAVAEPPPACDVALLQTKLSFDVQDPGALHVDPWANLEALDLPYSAFATWDHAGGAPHAASVAASAASEPRAALAGQWPFRSRLLALVARARAAAGGGWLHVWFVITAVVVVLCVALAICATGSPLQCTLRAPEAPCPPHSARASEERAQRPRAASFPSASSGDDLRRLSAWRGAPGSARLGSARRSEDLSSPGGRRRSRERPSCPDAAAQGGDPALAPTLLQQQHPVPSKPAVPPARSEPLLSNRQFLRQEEDLSECSTSPASSPAAASEPPGEHASAPALCRALVCLVEDTSFSMTLEALEQLGSCGRACRVHGPSGVLLFRAEVTAGPCDQRLRVNAQLINTAPVALAEPLPPDPLSGQVRVFGANSSLYGSLFTAPASAGFNVLALVHKSGREVLVPSLGADKLLCLYGEDDRRAAAAELRPGDRESPARVVVSVSRGADPLLVAVYVLSSFLLDGSLRAAAGLRPRPSVRDGLALDLSRLVQGSGHSVQAPRCSHRGEGRA